MAEGSYEYECMRAELLGIEKPDYDQFMKKAMEQAKKEIEEEEVDIEHLKEVDLEKEGINRMTGRLDELNNILKKTQSKINRMKASCGSVAGLIKTKIGSFSAQSSFDAEHTDPNEPSCSKATRTEGSGSSSPEEITTPENPQSSENGTSVRKSEIQKALDKDLSALDAMIEKAENAQYAMNHQNKQMKRFI
ncbi:uncharacterized protein LOC114342212 [Diabrotica virgifera virgifera]|uniref:Uncharacterized protein LOC114342212 n=1 Tax=Diabrotica virgifera virgifera TaxID=50390 RepID=A0A6P7GYF1_DIAVI|nr:uncharacterized protein LOC114342212 [Diabrotica virgifera virgifera]